MSKDRVNFSSVSAFISTSSPSPHIFRTKTHTITAEMSMIERDRFTLISDVTHTFSLCRDLPLFHHYMTGTVIQPTASRKLITAVVCGLPQNRLTQLSRYPQTLLNSKPFSSGKLIHRQMFRAELKCPK